MVSGIATVKSNGYRASPALAVGRAPHTPNERPVSWPKAGNWAAKSERCGEFCRQYAAAMVMALRW